MNEVLKNAFEKPTEMSTGLIVESAIISFIGLFIRALLFWS